jgi:transmembrane sensor
MGKFLSEEAAPEQGFAADTMPARRRRPTLIALCVGLACIMLLGGWLTLSRLGFAARDGAPELADVGGSTKLATRPGESRSYRLADGSSVVLRPNSRLAVSFDAMRRGLRLERGQARFEVAHETRPFVVAAGSGTVTARGTVFDVMIAADNHVTVKLLRGSVDVALPAASRSTNHAAPLVTRLSPGEYVDFAGMPTRPNPTLTPPVNNVSVATVELDHARLADLLLKANRNARIQIGLADTMLGELRVSGGLPIDDPERLANRLAWMFDLTVEHKDPSQIILRRR